MPLRNPLLPAALRGLRVPVIAAPLFIISVPRLVIAQCTSGVVGSFPALNARTPGQLEEWLHEITEALAAHDKAFPDRKSAPFAINQIVHKTNSRLDSDLAAAVKWRVPLTISSLGARADVNEAMHSVGGVVLHDVTNVAHAHKAIEKGADGLVAVCTGAGGHAGSKSPFALLQEIRAWFAGPLALSGAIATGHAVLAAQVAGADFAYVGSAFIATHEARASDAYKRAVVDGSSDDIVGSTLFTGVFGNYLKASITGAGLDPEKLPERSSTAPNVFGEAAAGSTAPKAWKDIWGCGQGIGAVKATVPAAEMVARLTREYEAAQAALAAKVALTPHRAPVAAE